MSRKKNNVKGKKEADGLDNNIIEESNMIIVSGQVFLRMPLVEQLVNKFCEEMVNKFTEQVDHEKEVLMKVIMEFSKNCTPQSRKKIPVESLKEANDDTNKTKGLSNTCNGSSTKDQLKNKKTVRNAVKSETDKTQEKPENVSNSKERHSPGLRMRQLSSDTSDKDLSTSETKHNPSNVSEIKKNNKTNQTQSEIEQGSGNSSLTVKSSSTPKEKSLKKSKTDAKNLSKESVDRKKKESPSEKKIAMNSESLARDERKCVMKIHNELTSTVAKLMGKMGEESKNKEMKTVGEYEKRFMQKEKRRKNRRQVRRDARLARAIYEFSILVTKSMKNFGGNFPAEDCNREEQNQSSVSFPDFGFSESWYDADSSFTCSCSCSGSSCSCLSTGSFTSDDFESTDSDTSESLSSTDTSTDTTTNESTETSSDDTS